MNKIVNTIFLLLLLANSLVAQGPKYAPNKSDAKGKQGWWQKFDKRGDKIYEGHFVDDKPVGVFNYYYEASLKLKTVIDFGKDGLVGRAKLYHLNGKLMAQGRYVDQKRDSLWKFYDEEEALLKEEFYSNGKKNGSIKSYYRSGKLFEIKNYVNDLENGEWKQYFETGNPKLTGFYKDGFLEGKVTYFYPDGKVYVDANYQHAVKHGVWTYYKKDGTKDYTEKYHLGKMTEGPPRMITPHELEKEKNNPRFKALEEEYQIQIRDDGGGRD